MSALGFQYIITPVLINVTVIFSIALLFNFCFKWRRYPAAIAKVEQITHTPDAALNRLSHQGIEHALRRIDSFIDVSEDDLNKIYRLAREFDQKKATPKGRGGG